jgi:hypothetical protein
VTTATAKRAATAKRTATQEQREQQPYRRHVDDAARHLFNLQDALSDAKRAAAKAGHHALVDELNAAKDAVARAHVLVHKL